MITGCVLAGGRGERLGGADKGLLHLVGQPLLSHVIARFAPQVGALIVSANRNQANYREYCATVVGDNDAEYGGPLAGIRAALAVATTPLLALVPCDSPFLPLDLVARLVAARSAHGAEIAVAATGGQLQPVFALLETRLHESLVRYLAAGDRKIDRWYASHAMAVVEFGAAAAELAFLNINTADELAAATARMLRA